MKALLMPLAVVVAGAGIGGGAAIGARHLVGPAPAHAAPEEPVPPVFVPLAKATAPLVTGDGALAGYVAFDADLEVSPDKAADVTAKLPLLLHAINMRTYRTPLAAGPDGMLPDIKGLAAVVQAAAGEALGRGVVRRVLITRAEPA